MASLTASSTAVSKPRRARLEPTSTSPSHVVSTTVVTSSPGSALVTDARYEPSTTLRRIIGGPPRGAPSCTSWPQRGSSGGSSPAVSASRRLHPPAARTTPPAGSPPPPPGPPPPPPPPPP